MPTYDLEITHNQEMMDVAYGQRALSGFTKLNTGTGSQTTGIKKIAQRFIQLLLTTAGSSIVSPGNGCSLLNSLKHLNIDTPEVMAAVHDAVDSAVLQIQQMETEDDPLSERLVTAEVSDPVFNEDRVGIALLLIMQNNETAELKLNVNSLIAL